MLVLRILRSVHTVTALQLSAYHTLSTARTTLAPDLKATLQSLRHITSVSIHGLWEVELLRKVMEVTAGFRNIQKIDLHELYCPASDEIYLELFQHFLNDFPDLKSFRFSADLASFNIYESLHNIACAAPARQIKSLAIYPHSLTMLFSGISQLPMEADLVLALLPSETRNVAIGLNASTFSLLVHEGKLLDVRDLTLKFPNERIAEQSATDNYLSSLPASFVYGTELTSLELETQKPNTLLRRLATAREDGEPSGAMPFPMLKSVRITTPYAFRWAEPDDDIKRARADGPALTRALAARDVTLEWKDAE